MTATKLIAVGVSEHGAPYKVYIADMEDAAAVLNEKDGKPGYNGEVSDYETGWEMFDRFQPFADCTSDEMRTGWLDCRNERLIELWEACREADDIGRDESLTPWLI